jgi:hypothetical protein
MARRNFATVDAVLIAICIVIFAGGVLAQTGAPFTSAQPPATSLAGDRP